MGIFDDILATQTVVVAPGRSVYWNGKRYWPGEPIILPTAQAEALAMAGFIVRPNGSPAALVSLSGPLEAALGVANVDAAISTLLQMVQALQGALPNAGQNGTLDFSNPDDSGLIGH